MTFGSDVVSGDTLREYWQVYVSEILPNGIFNPEKMGYCAQLCWIHLLNTYNLISLTPVRNLVEHGQQPGVLVVAAHGFCVEASQIYQEAGCQKGGPRQGKFATSTSDPAEFGKVM